MDRVDATKRSAIMRSVRSKDTKPELALRSAFHARGLRFRLHVSLLAGRPDIVLPRWRTCIFVHGCFWHRHGCLMTTTPKSNVDFWNAKFRGNQERDRRAIEALTSAGWRVLTVWQCGVTGKGGADACAAYVLEWLSGCNTVSEYPSSHVPLRCQSQAELPGPHRDPAPIRARGMYRP